MIYNKYKIWYNNIIEKALKENREYDTSSHERHHILPVCLGGKNDNENLVVLTYREHFLVHWLLIGFTEDEDKRKMRSALSMMTKRKGDRKKIISSWQFSVARKAGQEARIGKKRPDLALFNTLNKKGRPNLGVSEARKGKPSWNLGIPMREESKEKLSVTTKGIARPWVTEALTGRILSEEQITKRTKKMFGRKWYNNGT